MAGLTNCPVVTIFGPTSPIFGFAPSGDNDLVIQNNDLKCRPCHIHGLNECPVKNFECMKSIKSEYVFDKIFENKLLFNPE